MPELSVIIPAKNEEFLQNTIEDVLKNSTGDTEVIAILDGYWPDNGMPQHPKVNIIHHDKSIGQRAAVNEGVNLSQAKYIMKLDAHCSVDKGFDKKLIADCEYDWTVLPRMYTLHVFDWICKKCGVGTYQSGMPSKCEKCGGTEFEKLITWKRNKDKSTDYMWIDQDLRMRYFDGGCLKPYGDAHSLKKQCHHKYRDWAKDNITDVMVGVGCCFFMHRDRFLELGGMDEKHGSWGQMATEVAMKAWLSGGRQVINKNTWFAHLFRTQKGFGFPYKISCKDQEAARARSKELWLGNTWPLAKHDLQWMVNKFAPLPGWHIPPQKKEEKKIDRYFVEIPENVVLDAVPSQQSKIKPSKGVVYYTDNRCEERIAQVVRNQIKKCCYGIEIISVSQFPLDFGRNIVVPWERSVLTMFKQILAGLEASTANVVFLTEHDVIYHPSHFEFCPPKKDVYYYNENNWALDEKTGQALFYKPRQQVSGLCAYKNLLIDHYRARVERVEREGFTRKMGYEPGKPLPRGIDNFKREGYFSEYPNIDIKREGCLTPGRFKLRQYRCRNKIKDSWILADEIPSWGKTKDRFSKFLVEVSNA